MAGIRSGKIPTEFIFYSNKEDCAHSINEKDFTPALVSYALEIGINGKFDLTAVFKTDDVERYFTGKNEPMFRVSWEQGTIIMGVTRLNNQVDGYTKQEQMAVSMKPYYHSDRQLFSRKLISRDLVGSLNEMLNAIYSKNKFIPYIPKVLDNYRINTSANLTNGLNDANEQSTDGIKVVNILQNETILDWINKQVKRAIDPITHTPIFVYQVIEGLNVVSLQSMLNRDPIFLNLYGEGQIGDLISKETIHPGDFLGYGCLNLNYPIRDNPEKRMINNYTEYKTFNSYTGEIRSLNTINPDDVKRVIEISINGLNEMYDDSGFGQAIVHSIRESMETKIASVSVFMPKIVLQPGQRVTLLTRGAETAKDYIVVRNMIESSIDKGQQTVHMIALEDLSDFVKQSLDSTKEFAPNKRTMENK